MTDNEIIKALEICSHRNGDLPCKGCPAYSIDKMCMEDLMSDALDLINRQKAENESLKMDLVKCSIRLDNLYKTADEIKSEAIKEFWERLKERKKQYEGTLAGWTFTMTELDNLVKEMVGENG